jgi:hypothetical protein
MRNEEFWLCRRARWRALFIGAIIASSALSCLELVLIFQLNAKIGIPNLVFGQ